MTQHPLVVLVLNTAYRDHPNKERGLKRLIHTWMFIMNIDLHNHVAGSARSLRSVVDRPKTCQTTDRTGLDEVANLITWSSLKKACVLPLTVVVTDWISGPISKDHVWTCWVFFFIAVFTFYYHRLETTFVAEQQRQRFCMHMQVTPLRFSSYCTSFETWS